MQRLKRFAAGASGHVLVIEGESPELRGEAAMAIAATVLCHTSKDDACGRCPSCIYLDAGTHADLIVLPDDPGDPRIPVDDVRARVMSDSVMAPQLGAHKVYLLDGDKLNEQGQNALLKTLEEPAPANYYVLTVNKTERLLSTLISRAVTTTLHASGSEPVGTQDVDDAAQAEIRAWVLAIPGKRLADVLIDDMQIFETYRKTPEVIHTAAMRVFRDLVALRQGAALDNLEPKARSDYRAFLERYRPHSETLYRQAQYTERWMTRLRGNANFDMSCQGLLLAWRKEYPYG